jgi:uncharacterized protein YjcR
MTPQPYLTMADLAKLYRVHPRTARRWAAEDRWRRTGTRPVRYSLADAQQSYEARHAMRIQRHLEKHYGEGHGEVPQMAQHGAAVT